MKTPNVICAGDQKNKRLLSLKIFVLTSVIFLFNFLLSPSTFAQNAQNNTPATANSTLVKIVAAPETILRFSSNVVINKNASIMVTETIQIKTTNNVTIKRGIYRDFPTVYHGPYGSIVRVGFDVQGVLRDGKEERFRTTAIENGVRLYIGDPNVTLSPGTYTYVINYTTNRQIGFFDQYDELYWNVTGNDWNYPIENVEVVIDVPNEANILQYAAYTGTYGATGQDFSVVKLETGDIFFATTRPLLPHEGLTVAVAWQKGVVQPPTQFDKIMYFIKDNITLVTALASFLVVFLYYLVVWYSVGRGPEEGTIIPLFSPPQNISSAAMIYIKDMGLSSPIAVSRAFTASIVDLAVKGMLNIIKNPDYFSLRRKNEPTVNNTNNTHNTDNTATNTNNTATNINNTATLSAEEFFIAETLLSKTSTPKASTPKASAMSETFDLSKSNHQIIRETIVKFQKIIQEKYTKSYFVNNSGFFYLGLALSFLTYGLVQSLKQPLADQDFIFTVLLCALIVLNMVFFRLLKAPTALGRKIMDQIEGFKMFLSVTETERYKILNAPEVTTEVFEKYLPYAIALNVEKEWSKRLVNPEAYMPDWYESDRRAKFDTRLGMLGAISNLGRDMTSNITTVAPTNPPGSSSGSGGGGGSGRVRFET